MLVHAEDACDDGGKRSYTAPTQLVHIGGSQFSDRTLKVPTANHHTAVFEGLLLEQRGLAFPSADIAHGLPVRIPREHSIPDTCFKLFTGAPEDCSSTIRGSFSCSDLAPETCKVKTKLLLEFAAEVLAINKNQLRAHSWFSRQQRCVELWPYKHGTSIAGAIQTLTSPAPACFATICDR